MALQGNESGTSRLPSTRFEYDVFLSFHGEDTRNNFTGLFHYILDQKGINTFFDEVDLPKGGRIDEILEAIRKSKILVPIFSQRYAESKWCLREVAKMVECVDEGQERLIIPIFFDVDPRDVRNQTDPFEAAFKKHQKENRDEVDGWKSALRIVGEISGYDLKNYYKGNQPRLVDSIIDQIQKVLATKRLLHEEEYLVGVDMRVDEVTNLLDFETEGARIIGIHGIGGVGKTTLAKAIYNRSRHRFQASCFIENVREESKSSKGLVQLQQLLIQDISNDKHKKEINNSSQGTTMIEDKIRGKRVLLVLDDVDDQKQLYALAGNISRFHSGSRVIITTRQEKILEGLQVDAVYYPLEKLEEEDALQLFKHHAFGADGTQEDNDLIEEVVSISKRVPLALQVLGAHFKRAKTPEQWKKWVKDLRRHQHEDIYKTLRISYDSLDDEEKQIFLDIACLLVGKNSADATYVWEDLRLLPDQKLQSLQDRSLVKINKGKFEMHDQIRDMGREVVLRESRTHPENRSRLWDTKDIWEASTKSQRNMTEGIILNVHEGSKAELSTQAFGLLSDLRILHINFAFSGGSEPSDFRHFPASLKWLEWKGCPLETLPLESKFKSIVVLNLSGSSIRKLWDETTTGTSSKSVKKSFIGLKVLDLSSCNCLIAIPNFALAPNLKKLILDRCCSLKEVDVSIGYLKELEFLSMRECVSLEKLSNKIYELSSLRVFNLEGCRGLVTFPQILEDLKSVIELDPKGTSTSRILYINQTPHTDVTNSTIDLSDQKGLILRDCGSLTFLPYHRHMFPFLRSLHMDGCLEGTAFREWDIEAVYISGSPILPQKLEYSFVLPVGSISDPLLLQQLRCHGYGDPSLNGTMVLTVHRKELANERWIALDTYEVRSEDSNSEDDAYGHCYTITFVSNDKINEVPRGKITIMKVTTSNNCKLTKVDVKLQKRSKFSGENIKPFISISRREASTGPPPSLPPSSPRRSELQASIFLTHSEEEVKLDVIKYSTGIHNCIDQIIKQLNVQCDESMLLFGWTTKELIIIFTLILSDINVFLYKLEHGTGLLRPASLELFDGLKVLDLSSCHCLIATPNFAMAPNLEKLILDQCIGLKEVDDSIRYLKKLVFLSMRECVSLEKLPNKIYELSSLQVFNLEGCRGLVAFPQILEDSKSAIELHLDGTPPTFLPTSTSEILYINQTPYIDVKNSTIDGLKVLDLSSCHCIIATPNFAMAPNLEKLILDLCVGLIKVDDSIGYLKKLIFLSMRKCVSLKKLPSKIYELSSLQVFNLEGCRALVALPQILEDSNSVLQLDPYGTSTSRILYIYQTPHIDITNSPIDLSNQEGLVLRDCGSLKFLPDHPRMFPSLRCLHVDGCLQDMLLREWDIEAVYSAGSPTLPQKQEYSFVLPVGSISDPLLVQQLRCHGFGDPCMNGTMVLTVHYKELTNKRWISLDTHEAHAKDCNSKDDVYGHCYTINFGSNDKINEVPRGKTTIMKVTTSSDCKLTKVDVKLQNRSKFCGENMKPFISISRREAFIGPPPSLPLSSSRKSKLQFSIFFNHSEEEVKLDVIEDLTWIDNCIDQIMKQLNVRCDEQMLLFGWTIKELIIIFILILSDMNVFWYELGHGIGLPRPASLEVFDKIKILDLSYCKFLVKSHDFAWSPNLVKLVLDHCEHLLEIDESIGQLKNLIRLSIVGCTKLRALPCSILQLNSLKVLNMEKCPEIMMLPEAMDVSLDALEVLILDECTSLTGIPDYVGGFRRLRHLSLRNCDLLEQLPTFVGRLTALEELNVAGCSSLVCVPGLQMLISLKVLDMCRCLRLDLGWMLLQLEVAEFHDLEAFDISAFTCRHYVSISFPIGRRTSSNPLLLEKIDVLVRTDIGCLPSHVLCEIKVAEPMKNGVPCYVDAYVRGEGLTREYRTYSARIGEDDEINKRLRVLAATSSDHASRVGTLDVSCCAQNFFAERFDVHMVSANCRRRREGLN